MYICMYICICMYKWCVCTYGWAGLSAVAVAHNVGATMEARNLWVSLPPLFIKAEFLFRCYRWSWLYVCVCRGVCELKLHSAFPLRPSCVSRGNVILLFYLARNVGDHAEPLIETERLDPQLGLNLVRDANLRNIRDVVTWHRKATRDNRAKHWFPTGWHECHLLHFHRGRG